MEGRNRKYEEEHDDDNDENVEKVILLNWESLMCKAPLGESNLGHLRTCTAGILGKLSKFRTASLEVVFVFVFFFVFVFVFVILMTMGRRMKIGLPVMIVMKTICRSTTA